MLTKSKKDSNSVVNNTNLIYKLVTVKEKSVKEYICPTCKHPFRANADLRRHINKINKCVERKVSSKIIEECKCDCGKIFSRPSTLKDHVEKCLVMKEKKQTNIIGNIPLITKQYDDIVSPYTGEYPISSFSSEELNIFLQPDSDFYLTYFKIIFCNENKPLHHNIFYPPGQIQNILVYTTKYKWEEKSSTNIITEMLFNIRKELIVFSQYINKKNRVDIINRINYHTKTINQQQLNLKNIEDYSEIMKQLCKNIRSALRKHSETIIEKVKRKCTEEFPNIYPDSYSNSSSDISYSGSINNSVDFSYDRSANNSIDISVSGSVYDSFDDFS